MFQSNPSCRWAPTRNNYIRKMSFLFSIFSFLSNLNCGFHSFSLSFLPLFTVLFCCISACLACVHIIPSSSFVVPCHSFLQCIVCLHPPSPFSFYLTSFQPKPQNASVLVKIPTCEGNREESKRGVDNVIVVLDGTSGGRWERRTVV